MTCVRNVRYLNGCRKGGKCGGGRDYECEAGDKKGKDGNESNDSSLESIANLKMLFAIGIN